MFFVLHISLFAGLYSVMRGVLDGDQSITSLIVYSICVVVILTAARLRAHDAQ